MALRLFVLVGAVLAAMTSVVNAEKLKVAVAQRGFWNSMPVEFAIKQGFFKKYGLEIEIFYTSGGSETLQVVMTGSVDVAMSNGFARCRQCLFQGRADPGHRRGDDRRPRRLLVRKGGQPDQKPEGRRRQNHRLFAPRLFHQFDLLNLLKDTGSKAKPVSTGGLPATMTQVMTGQIDIGWAVPPFGVKDLNDGKIRIVATGGEAKALQNVRRSVSMSPI